MSNAIGTFGPAALGGLGTFGSGSASGGTGAKRWMVPGWCGCCSCTYFLDKFTRADSSDLGANWTESAGSWVIGDYRLETTSSSGFCQCDVEGDDDEHVVSASVRGMAVGDQARLISSKILTADTYWFLEVTWQETTATLELFHVVAGTPTQRGSTTTLYNMSPGIPLHLRICFDDSTIAAQYRRDTGDIFTTATSYAAGTTDSTCGVGTGTVNGEVRFDDFRLEQHGSVHPGCPTCAQACFACSGVMPDEFLIVPTGQLDTLPPLIRPLMPDNGYVVRRIENVPCTYRLLLEPTVYGFDRVVLQFGTSFLNTGFNIRFYGSTPGIANWYKPDPSLSPPFAKPACGSYSAEGGWIWFRRPDLYTFDELSGTSWEVTAL